MLEWIVQLVILSSMHLTIALRKLTIFLVAGSPSCSPSGKITIADQHYLNTSDHTHLELSLKMASSSWLLPEAPTQDPSRGAKIRWEKCDTDLYREIVQESLSAAPILAPLSDLDADIHVCVFAP